MTTSIDHLLKHELLTRDEERALLVSFNKLRKRHGPEHVKTLAVRNRLVLANMKLVVKFANKIPGLPLEDRIGAGVEGLVVGIERFDMTKPYRLSTYASHWIRHHIGRATEDTSRTVRVPVAQQAKRRHGLAMDGVALEGKQHSMDASVAHGGGGYAEHVTLHDLLHADEDEPSLDDCVSRERLYEAMMSLTARERKVIEARFGLLTDRKIGVERGEELTLKQAGREIDGLCRERIRQVEASALEKLRKTLQPERRVKGPHWPWRESDSGSGGA